MLAKAGLQLLVGVTSSMVVACAQPSRVAPATAESAATRVDPGSALASVSPVDEASADIDKDGISNLDDQCPDQPEDLDGEDDADGCPDLRCRLDPCAIKLLEPVHFAFDKWDIDERSHPLLNDMAYVLRANPQITVEIAGHTDSEGRDDYNQELSQRRVASVAKHLIGLGVPSFRMIYTGYGESVPTETNLTAKGRAANRRVEIHRTDDPACRRP
jgi:OOP family OmpA-OmpF porin